jgi:aryl-alcohol dehydrogenase-like predicted oxidoreductase
MKYRELGVTGLKVSEIGFGAWGIGGVQGGAVSYGPTDDGESRRALQRAHELGITFYDTSDLYGFGHSEELIGEALEGKRHDIVIATKVGMLGPYGPQDFSPAHIRRAIRASLRRLRTDYVDLYQLHNPPLELLENPDGVIEVFEDLKSEGSIRAYGVSLRSPSDALVAVQRAQFKSLQVNFNMLDQRILQNGLFARCRDASVGIICRTPLCFGFLTGKYAAAHHFSADDHRSKWSGDQISLWANAWSVFGQALREQLGATPAQLALRFCLSYPEVTTTIPGMKKAQQVEENALSSDLAPFSEQVLQQCEAIYRRNSFFVGPQQK